MERKAPPPFARPGAPGTPPTEQNAHPPPQTFGFPSARAPVNTSATRRGWRPGRVGGRHDSPLYGKHRKRPSSSSIDSNVSWSGSEIESVGAQEQLSRLSWASEAPPAHQELASASSLFGAPVAGQEAKQAPRSDDGRAVHPPKTPLGKPLVEAEGGLSAAQRVRMELSTHASSRTSSRANSSENVLAVNPPAYDEEKHGPQSCPSTFSNLKQAQFSLDKIRAMRSNELVASKLLPTRTSVNSLMGYVRELQLSEATLRKQLVKTKQHTEKELTQSLSKVSELERSMQEVERDREAAKRKLEEQEQLIRDLAAKLKQAEAAKAKTTAASAVDELPTIAEELNPQAEIDAKAMTMEESEPAAFGVAPPPPAPSAQPVLPPVHQEQAPPPSAPSGLPKDSNRAAQFGLASPRSPNRPLWDPWATGGATPMKNLPPVFSIGSTGLDLVVASSTSTAQTPTTGASTSASGDYELKSVLMSPRRVQEAPHAQQPEHTESSVPSPAQEEFTAQYPAPMFNVGAMPSSPYPQQQDFESSETQNDAYGVPSQKDVPLMASPSQAVPMLPAETRPETEENSFAQQQLTGAPANGSAADDYNATEWSGGVQAQEELPPPADSFAPPVGPGMENSADTDSTFPEHQTGLASSAAPVEDAQSQHDASQAAEDEPYTENITPSAPAVQPVGSLSPPPPPASEISKPRPASPAQKEQKAASTEPVSLETLLVDFFTEVDNKRLKMAKVYGKRYAGREKWLFAELTKRYGAAKVSSLKVRFETGSAAAATNTSNDATKTQPHTSSMDASDHPKPVRQGHPRHPQFFHPQTPASNVDLSTDMPAGPSQAPPPLVLPQENEVANAQGQQATEGFAAPPGASGNVSPGRPARVSPRVRRSGGNLPPFGGPPTTFSLPQGLDEGNSAATDGVGSDDPPVMTAPPPSTQLKESSGQFNQPPPPPPQNGMETSDAAPMGLRQRHNASAQGQKSSVAEPPSVTLESLLKELYKKHQPDKLKNVAMVAKQYAGKERELVGLLRGKYGALSVKQLEENLEVLERAHRSRTGSNGSGKKRGCFVLTISLVFWLTVLLYFSLGAVFASFVVLDAWECRSFDSEEQEQEADECVPLKKELDAFTYERVGDYVSQTHPDVCFCSEWLARESALFSSLSGEELVNLARLVPFSPDSFGEPWVATVKEQVPSQEFYESYAKPVVDLSLNVGSFVWSSVLELAGYDEAEEEDAQVTENVTKNDTMDLPLLDNVDAHVDSLEHPSDETEKETFASDEETGDQLAKNAEVEVDSIEMLGVVESEHVPVEEQANTSEENLQIEDVDVPAEGDVKVDDGAAQMEENDAVPVEEDTTQVETNNAEREEVSVDEESYRLASEAAVEKDVSVGESIDELKSEAVQPIEDTELIEDAQPIEEAQSIEDAQPIEDVESMEGAQPIEDVESMEGAQPIEEAESIEVDQPIEEAESIEEAQPIENVESTEDAESVEDAQPIEEAESMEDAQPIEDAESIENAQPIERAESMEDAQPIEYAESIKDIQSIEETESVNASEEKPIAVPETEVEEVPADDSNINTNEKDESVGGDDDEDDKVSSSTETEVADVVAEDASSVASETASETEESSGSGDIAAASEDVVEVEVRQEGLDLSYPEAETDAGAVEDTTSAESTDVASSDADAEPELAPTDGVEVLSVSSEAEEGVVESNDAASDELERGSKSVESVADQDSSGSSNANDASSAESELDVSAPDESDAVATENVETKLSISEDVEVETSSELAEEAKPASKDGESSILVGIDVYMAMLASREAIDSLSEELELEGDDDAVIPMETGLETETSPKEKEVGTSDGTLEEEEGSIEVQAETDLASSSSDNVAEDLLVEEDTTGSANEQPPAGADESDNNHPAAVEDQEPVPEDDDASLNEAAIMVSSTDEVDEPATPAVDDPVASEGGAADVLSDEEAELQLAEELKEVAEEDAVTAIAEDEETSDEESSKTSEVEFASPKAAEESVSKEANEVADAGNDDAAPAEVDEVEVEQPASDEVRASELADDAVTIEATEAAAAEEEIASPEPVDELKEHTDGSVSIDAFVAEEGTEALAGYETEPSVAVDEEPHLAGDESDVVASAEEIQVTDSIQEVAPDAEQASDDPSHVADHVDGSEEAFVSGELVVDDEATEPPQVEDEIEEESGGLVSAVNEVLARLVEPFEAAKTAEPVVATGGEHAVNEL